MTTTIASKYSYKKGFYLADIKLTGPENMALDVMLLEKSIKEKHKSPWIRFYKWNGTWLSIGKNQKEIPSNWQSLSREGKIKLVRSPSGGKAVLHSGGLTYALVLPSPPRGKIQP